MPFTDANEIHLRLYHLYQSKISRMGGLADKDMEEYFTCCGKSICGGCIHSFGKTGNNVTCLFCNSERDKTEEEHVEDLMKRAETNDPLR